MMELKRSFSEIPRFLTPYREFEQCPHTPHWRQLDSNSRYGARKYSRVTSTFNFDASFRQILGMESEILWESEITPTLDTVKWTFLA
jgi:hypothetical protein